MKQEFPCFSYGECQRQGRLPDKETAIDLCMAMQELGKYYHISPSDIMDGLDKPICGCCLEEKEVKSLTNLGFGRGYDEMDINDAGSLAVDYFCKDCFAKTMQGRKSRIEIENLWSGR